MSTSTLYIQNETGDTRIEWDKDNEAETEIARKAFQALKDKRYLTYKTRADGSRGELLREWDPTAERIVASPQLVGG